MGHRPPRLPVAPLHRGQLAVLTVWMPALLVPGRFATEGLGWVRTSGGGRCVGGWGGGGGAVQGYDDPTMVQQ